MKCDASCANDAFAALRPTGQQISAFKKALPRAFFYDGHRAEQSVDLQSAGNWLRAIEKNKNTRLSQPIVPVNNPGLAGHQSACRAARSEACGLFVGFGCRSIITALLGQGSQRTPGIAPQGGVLQTQHRLGQQLARLAPQLPA